MKGLTQTASKRYSIMTNKKFTNHYSNSIEMFHGNFISVYARMNTNIYGIDIDCCIVDNNNKQIAEFEWEDENIVIFYKGNVLYEMHYNDNEVCNEIKEFFDNLGFRHTDDIYNKSLNLTFVHFTEK